MDSKELAESIFVKNILELMSNSIMPEPGSKDRTEVVKYADATEDDKYIRDIFEKTSTILETYEYLCFIPIFLRRFPDKQYFNQNGIDRAKYLRYHLENHFIKVSTIVDQSITLVSYVFRLGVPTKQISLSTLTNNSFTKNSSSVSLLKDLVKATQNIKAVRNVISHQGKFDDQEVSKIGTYYFLKQFDLDGFDKFMPEFLLKHLTKKTVKEKLKLVEGNNYKIKKFLFALFSTLEGEFGKQYDKLT